MAQTEQLQAIEQQLSCPQGTQGVAIADMMHATNMGMTMAGFNQLGLPSCSRLLEIGHGNAAHLSQLQAQVSRLHYTGLELSALMQQEASRHNQAAIKAQQAVFLHYAGQKLPPFSALFDGILTVNTVYFWPEPLAFAQQLKHALKPSGHVAIAYMDVAFLQSLPFVGERFQPYTSAELEQLLRDAGFEHIRTHSHQDTVPRKDTGELVARRFHVTTAH